MRAAGHLCAATPGLRLYGHPGSHTLWYACHQLKTLPLRDGCSHTPRRPSNWVWRRRCSNSTPLPPQKTAIEQVWPPLLQAASSCSFKRAICAQAGCWNTHAGNHLLPSACNVIGAPAPVRAAHSPGHCHWMARCTAAALILWANRSVPQRQRRRQRTSLPNAHCQQQRQQQ